MQAILSLPLDVIAAALFLMLLCMALATLRPQLPFSKRSRRQRARPTG
jgi:hypothetical protein